MIACALPSRREKLAEPVDKYYYACLRGDYRCYSSCPYLETCWKEEDESERESQTT